MPSPQKACLFSALFEFELVVPEIEIRNDHAHKNQSCAYAEDEGDRALVQRIAIPGRAHFFPLAYHTTDRHMPRRCSESIGRSIQEVTRYVLICEYCQIYLQGSWIQLQSKNKQEEGLGVHGEGEVRREHAV